MITEYNLPQVLKSFLLEGHAMFYCNFYCPLFHFKSYDLTVLQVLRYLSLKHIAQWVWETRSYLTLGSSNGLLLALRDTEILILFGKLVLTLSYTQKTVSVTPTISCYRYYCDVILAWCSFLYERLSSFKAWDQ